MFTTVVPHRADSVRNVMKINKTPSAAQFVLPGLLDHAQDGSSGDARRPLPAELTAENESTGRRAVLSCLAGGSASAAPTPTCDNTLNGSGYTFHDKVI